MIDVLAGHLETRPDAVLYRYLHDGDVARAETWSYAETYARAAAVARRLTDHGLAGERVLLLHAPGLDYVAAFLGCLLARAIAVPAYPPEPSRLASTLPRVIAIARAARVAAIATSTALCEPVRAVLDPRRELAGVRWLYTDALPVEPPGRADGRWLASPASDDLAYLQFTSGSTSTPKGVRITHGNLVHNSRAIRDMFGIAEGATGVSWLPPYHDMGLIGGIVQPLFVGGAMTLISPLDFLKRPMRWLEAISRFAATTSGGPDFAYELCTLRRVSTGSLDLSSWRVAFTGSEPVRAQTLDRFAELMAPHGFDRRAFYPCYGLAEATLFATGGAPLAGAVELAVAREALAAGRAEPVDVAAGPAGAGDAGGDAAVAAAIRLVACGHTAAGHELAIVAPGGAARCADGEVGEIWLAGGSVADGYWEAPEATAEAFGLRIVAEPAAGPFLRTGDLGFVTGGQLYVTGRCKDLIIVRGRNHYPQDIEATLSEVHRAVRPRSCVAYPLTGGDGAEGAGVAIEVRARDAATLDAVIAAVRAAVALRHELALDEIALIPQRALPKTSSGKPVRAATRDGIASGAIASVLRWRRDAAAAPAARDPSAIAPVVIAAGELRRWLIDQVARRARCAPET
ncbi:MAG TPA: fatty acyl-AMP ligase, partial [Kofleriaceae bacterium]|nr:fatty acyl-AMP ligase [Kofleriaceae bacterium]